MLVGLIIRLTSSEHLQSLVKFDYQIFFNVLLPPIILNSGYELHQVPFFLPLLLKGVIGWVLIVRMVGRQISFAI